MPSGLIHLPKVSSVTPVTFDALGTAGQGLAGFNPSITANGSHNCSGPNPAVIVAVSCVNNGFAATGQTRTATYDTGGTPLAMTSLGFLAYGDGAAFTEIFGLLNPPLGAKNWSAVSSGGGNTGREIIANSLSYNNVGSFGAAFTNSAASGTAMSLATASAINRMIAQAFGTGETMSAYNQTQRYFAGVTSGVRRILIGDAQGNTSPTFTATRGASGAWSAVGVELLPL